MTIEDHLSLIKMVEEKLVNELKELTKIPSPTSSKGSSYEDELKEFLEKYLGSIYDFHARVSIVDYMGLSFDVFKSIENEFDVVATYKTTIPKIFLENKNIKYIPYDAVAFIIQLKQDLDKNKLKNDLEKLQKIRSLSINPNRFTVNIEYLGSNLLVGSSKVKPLNILIYLNKKARDDEIEKLLRSYKECWDYMLVINSCLYINSKIVDIIYEKVDEMFENIKRKIKLYNIKTITADIIDNFKQKIKDEITEIHKKSFMTIKDFPLLTMITQIPTILPYPIICNALGVFHSPYIILLLPIIFPELADMLGEEFIEVYLNYLNYY